MATAGAFLAQGLVFLALTTRLPQLQAKFALSSLAVSALLLIVVLMAGVGSVLSELVASRRGSALGLRTGLLLMVVGLATIGSAQTLVQLCLGLAVYGLCLGMVDAGTNMQAVALEHRVAQPILPTFHSAWTLGGILGTLITLATPRLSFGAGVFVVLAIPVLASMLPFLGTDKDAAQPAITAQPATASLPANARGRLRTVAADRAGGPGDRAVLHGRYGVDHLGLHLLRQHPALPRPTGRTGNAAVSARILRRSVRRRRADPQTRAGAVAARRRGGRHGRAGGGGVRAELAGRPDRLLRPWPRCRGDRPLSFSAAAAIAREGVNEPAIVRARVDSVIARFNQFNYAGALLGAVMTGIFGAGTLRIGFAVPMVLIVGILPLATAFGQVTGAES
ncbi:MAG: MFS transporter [Actinomycetota bacterium]|nr:MFS transporter [Actinomycetota bacterium]